MIGLRGIRFQLGLVAPAILLGLVGGGVEEAGVQHEAQPCLDPPRARLPAFHAKTARE